MISICVLSERKVKGKGTVENLLKEDPQHICEAFLNNYLLVVAVIAILAPVKAEIECIEVLGVQSILHDPQGFTKPLEVHNLSHAQELDGLADIRILHKAKDVVIGSSRLLLCRHILHQIRDNVAGGLELGSSERNTASRLGPDTYGMIYVVIRKDMYPFPLFLSLCANHKGMFFVFSFNC